MQPFELRAAVHLAMDAANVCKMPAVCAALPPEKWPWGTDQQAAFRAYCEKHGVRYSPVPSVEGQTPATVQYWQHLVTSRVRPLALAQPTARQESPAPVPAAAALAQEEVAKPASVASLADVAGAFDNLHAGFDDDHDADTGAGGDS